MATHELHQILLSEEQIIALEKACDNWSERCAYQSDQCTPTCDHLDKARANLKIVLNRIASERRVAEEMAARGCYCKGLFHAFGCPKRKS